MLQVRATVGGEDERNMMAVPITVLPRGIVDKPFFGPDDIVTAVAFGLINCPGDVLAFAFGFDNSHCRQSGEQDIIRWSA